LLYNVGIGSGHEIEGNRAAGQIYQRSRKQKRISI
jgi:hypothetical protein